LRVYTGCQAVPAEAVAAGFRLDRGQRCAPAGLQPRLHAANERRRAARATGFRRTFLLRHCGRGFSSPGGGI
jgi:hypothetical protein